MALRRVTWAVFDRILVPTDGSDGTGRVVDRASGLARMFHAAIDALYVVDTRPYDGVDLGAEEDLELSAMAAGRQAVSAVGDRAADAGLDVTETIRTGIPDAEIVTYAVETGTDLVVMGTHGRTGIERAALGSTAERVLREADIPVVTVRLTDGTDAGDEAGYDDILVPTDGSDPAGRATERAVAFAEAAGATLHALYVVDSSIFEHEDAPRSILGTLRQGGGNAVTAVEGVAEDAGLPATGTVAEGNPTAQILAAADEVGADLVALGRRGRTGRPDVLLGSTAARVVRLAGVPVLSVP